jgi:hypothetical protein
LRDRRKLRFTNDRLEELARERFPAHDDLIAEGYRLGASSGLWLQPDGTATARFVYRMPGSRPAGVTTIAITVRRMQVQYA